MDNRIVTGSQAQASESSFISKVFLWMAAGLGVSGAASVWLLSQPALMRAFLSNGLLLIGLVIAEFALVIWLSRAALRMSTSLATSVFLGYSFLNGLTLLVILFPYTRQSLLSTFAVTAGTFLFFSVYGIMTKKDLTSLGNLAFMGLIGVILATLVNFFLKSSGLMWVTTFIGIAVFLGLIAYDTQKLKAMHAMGFDSAETQKKAAVLGALALYLDFINLFVLLLRVFGRQRN